MATILTAQELAVEFETDARTIRKFLRSVTPKENQPGKGKKWGIEKKSLRTLRKQYSEWVPATPVADEEAPPEE